MTAAAPAVAHEGLTTHVRYAPFERRFSFKLAQILIDIDRIAATAKALRLLSHNQFNLFSFHDRDHGDRSGAPLRPWALARFAEAGVDLGAGRIDLLCFPRMAGFVFNPISVFFGYDEAGALRGIIYEVNNTFGETHAYVAPVARGSKHEHQSAKVFHVSPLFAIRGDYHFRVQTPGDTFKLSVLNVVDGEREHLATLNTRARPLTDRWLAKVFITMPLMTMQVVAGIHWHALKLLLRGARYHKKPPLPADATTFAHAPSTPHPDRHLVDIDI